MKILIAIVIFSAIILIHELGHFLLAKINGIGVTEFSLGMGPRLFSVQKGETRYSVKLFPLGGSCAMVGEDTAEEELQGSFNAAPVLGRISVVAAGPVFNFILAFILSVIIVGFVGYDPAEIVEVQKGSAASEAGIEAGDVITEYNGYHVDLAKDLYVYSYLNGLKEGDTVTLKVRRDGEIKEIRYTPDVSVRYLLGFNRSDASSMTVESLIAGMPLDEAGLQPGDTITAINGTEIADGEAYDVYLKDHPLSNEPVEITYVRDGLDYTATITPQEYRTPQLGFSYNLGYEKTSGLGVLKYGTLEVKYMIRTTLLSLKQLVTGNLGFKDLSGPVGVVDAIGTTYEQSRSEGTLMLWMNMLNMAVLLSANLGVMNLLPLPALDGGRLVFLVVEAIRRKPINREIEGMVHFAGLMLLMALMVVVMYNDILKIF
ncbi:MAG: RIP metalloprotease RseP [Eubacteriales bacterium]|nr:RIP metalloprotease RseP [Eubacteriales bacterium]